MKTLLLAGVLMVGLVGVSEAARRGGGYKTYGTGSRMKSTPVKGHIRKNGTYVAPSRRTAPNRTKSDNYGTAGNFNPWTGKTGTESAD